MLKKFLILTTVITIFSFAAYSQNTKETEPIRILSIGNSFSVNGQEYLDDIAIANGRKIIFGNIYRGGCSLEKHYDNIRNNTPDYTYYKFDGQQLTKSPKYTFDQCLKDEKWDYITFQQSSPLSGIESSYYPYIKEIYEYVIANAPKKDFIPVMFQTWAYASDYKAPRFDTTYHSDQVYMYHKIVKAYKNVCKNMKIKKVLPCGTAIQNGRTSSLGDRFCKDGYHLNLQVGCYTAACVWFEVFFGEAPKDETFIPTGMTREQVSIAREAARRAVHSPYRISNMSKF